MVSWQMKWRRRSTLSTQQIEAVNVEEAEPRHSDFQHSEESTQVPETQSALLLHTIRQPYEVKEDYPTPTVLRDDELLVKITAVGLNPIDWKAPYVYSFKMPSDSEGYPQPHLSKVDLALAQSFRMHRINSHASKTYLAFHTNSRDRDYNFGIPVLPYISGRELVGIVLQAPSLKTSSSTSTSSPSNSSTSNSSTSGSCSVTTSLTNTTASRIQKGDIVIIPSTDYRDLRRAAFQQYSIASSFNTIRLPVNVSQESGSILGVAFVAAVLALGICMGVDFTSILDGPDLLAIVRGIDEERLPKDIRKECVSGIEDGERAKKGDWLVIWGGSSTCAFVMKQIAKLAGLKIISVVDSSKHGLRLSNHDRIRPDLVVDSHDAERAISIIRATTGNNAKFGFDTVGKDTAAHLIRALASSDTASVPNDAQEYETVKFKLPTPPSSPSEPIKATTSHLVGLTGVPKTNIPTGVALHSVPIKLFHEIPEVGEALSEWCERLLVRGLLVPPAVVGTVDGLEGINEGLNRLRRREVRGGRLVATLR
jgi:NADPH:quinone reductase-like Zn-dependent oxidoreductase